MGSRSAVCHKHAEPGGARPLPHRRQRPHLEGGDDRPVQALAIREHGQQRVGGGGPVRRRALDLDVELGAPRRPPEHVIERRRGRPGPTRVEPSPGVERLQVGQRPLAHRPLAGDGAAELAIVQHHELAVARQLDVELDHVHADLQRPLERRPVSSGRVPAAPR
jgi:hypothetical protein